MPEDLQLYDTHCHLGFLPDPAQHARDAAALGMSCLSAGVEPAGWEAEQALLGVLPNVTVGLGLHPWWVAEDVQARAEQLEAFERLLPSACLVAEVGLDFGQAHIHARAAQTEALRRIGALCAETPSATPGGRRILSVHAVRAAGEALDVLGQTGALEACTCIFHWFSGTSEELARAVRAGCLLSVGPRMLATRRGRAYAQSVPADRLLLETDLPGAAGETLSAAEHRAALIAALEVLAGLRREPDLVQRLAQNAANLHVAKGFRGEPR